MSLLKDLVKGYSMQKVKEIPGASLNYNIKKWISGLAYISNINEQL